MKNKTSKYLVVISISLCGALFIGSYSTSKNISSVQSKEIYGKNNTGLNSAENEYTKEYSVKEIIEEYPYRISKYSKSGELIEVIEDKEEIIKEIDKQKNEYIKDVENR